MMKACEKNQAAILGGDDRLPPDVQTHLSVCADCRNLAAAWAEVREAVDTPVPPAALDRAILTAAAQRSTGFRVLPRRTGRVGYWMAAAAAACVALVVGVFSYLGADSSLSPVRNTLGNSPMAAWNAGFDRHMFEVDTDLEVNREMINLGPDRSRQEVLDVLLPLPASAAMTDPADNGDDNMLII